MTGKERKQGRKQVAALIRVSSLAQSEKYGIPAQKDKIDSIAAVCDLDVKWHFQIEGVSGSEVRRNPQMKELLKLCKSGLCDGIVMSEQSRLMRRVDSEVFKILEDNKVLLYSPDAVINFSNPDEKLVGTIKGAVSEHELSVIRARMLGGKFSKRKRGEWASGAHSVPYGLELYEDGKRSLLRVKTKGEKNIEHIKDLFEKFIEGGGLTSFAELARETGIPPRSIEYILQNELYTGFHVPKKTADPKLNVYRPDGSIRYQGRRMIPVEERERIKMFDDAPISEARFTQVQRLLALRKEMRVKVKQAYKDDPFLYRGLLRCGYQYPDGHVCGRNIISLRYTKTGKYGNKYHAEYYVCIGARGQWNSQGGWKIKNGTCPTRRIRREVLEPVLDEIIASRLGDAKFLAKVIEAEERSNDGSSEARIETLNSEIKSLEESIKRTQELVARGKIPYERFDEIDGELQLELRAARTALAKTRPNLGRITPEAWKPIAQKLRQWRKLDTKGQRALLSALGATFEVTGSAGKRFHETVIKVKAVRVNLSGGRDEAGEVKAEIEDDPGRSGVVPIGNRTYSAVDITHSDIYLRL